MSLPFDRQPRESGKAWAACLEYCRMGRERSTEKVQQQYSYKTPRLILRWSSRFGWVERARIWDQVEQERLTELWRQRQVEIREADHRQAAALRDLVDKIMAEGPQFIKARRRFVPGKNGEPDREIVTLALNGELAVKALEAASKLQRLAAEMATDKTEVDATITPRVILDE